MRRNKIKRRTPSPNGTSNSNHGDLPSLEGTMHVAGVFIMDNVLGGELTGVRRFLLDVEVGRSRHFAGRGS